MYMCPPGKVIQDGEICHAQYLSGTPTIIEVEQNDNIEVMKKNLFHEMLHSCYDGIGNTAWEKMFGTLDEDEANTREEETVSFLEDKLYDLLTRNGLLRIPNPPRQKV